MELNADFSKRVVMHGDALDWQASPLPGVARRMLDRIGDEVARATTIVRYDPGSRFSPHTHTGGEEFLVLDGEFQDEHGDFPAGSYIRNPPRSSHTPGSERGCTILVKLWQFDLNDRTSVRIDTNAIGPTADANRAAVSVIPLFVDQRETVRIEIWEPDAEAIIDADGGAEIFVLEGALEENGDKLRRHSWLRVPIGENLSPRSGPQGARLWIKSGHLRHMDPHPQS